MIKLYDTRRRQKVDFEPVEPGKVSMYVCGPTVYNRIHIGNARTFISFDMIRRYLSWRGFDVTFVQNVTDVDDKIIRRAAGAHGRRSGRGVHAPVHRGHARGRRAGSGHSPEGHRGDRHHDRAH